MTFKAAMAELPYGGGKTVIIGDPRTGKSEALFRALGRCIESLGGRYFTGEDVGTAPADMDFAREETAYVLGRTRGGGSGDPSPVTARGVWLGIRAAVRHQLGRDGSRRRPRGRPGPRPRRLQPRAVCSPRTAPA